MTMRFVGRERELQVLKAEFGRAGSALLPVYGRRRVGKSELILRFLAGKRAVYFLGKQAPAELQLREFLREAARALEEPLLADQAVAGWSEALALVTTRWPGRAKRIIVLDEFQWTAAASPELPSVLQELWDRRWKSTGDMFLILCGSFVGFMERAVLGRQSPLFGRRTAQIHLKPFGYREAAEFHPGFSVIDKARTYFVCGGVPLYLNCFSARSSVEINIMKNFLDQYGMLFGEANFLLREELREVEKYHAVLVALASGQVTNREISRATGIGERSLHYYLQQLVELGYLERRYPLADAPAAKRHVRYDLADPLLRFWARFIFPHTSYILRAGPERALRNLVIPELNAYFGRCFEKLCREALAELYLAEGVTAAFEIGEYWDKEMQIDVVGRREDRWTDLGECKWSRVGSLRRLEGELEAKVKRYPNPRNATIGRRLFVRQLKGRRPALPASLRVHTIDDLYQ